MCKFHFFPPTFNLSCADSDPSGDVSAGHGSSLLPGFLFPSSRTIFFVGLLPGLGWGQLGPSSFYVSQVKSVLSYSHSLLLKLKVTDILKILLRCLVSSYAHLRSTSTPGPSAMSSLSYPLVSITLSS